MAKKNSKWIQKANLKIVILPITVGVPEEKNIPTDTKKKK